MSVSVGRATLTAAQAAEILGSGAIFLAFAGRRSEVMGRDPRCIGGVGCGFASYSTLQTDSSRCGQKLGDANEIVGDSSQDEEPFHQAAPTMPGLAQTADGLHPAKGFFDPLALDRADAIAGWRVVRASIAERRLALFCETCGVQPRSRQPATKSAVS